MTRESTPNQTPAAPEENGRDAGGKFTKGNKGGPGNPFARRIAELRAALVNTVTAEDLAKVAAAMIKKAGKGDVAAARLVFQYVLGKPSDPPDPDRVDVDEWENVKEHARPPSEMAEVLDRLPAAKASELTRIVWPCSLAQRLHQPVLAGLEAMGLPDAPAEGNGQPSHGGGQPPSTNGPNRPGPGQAKGKANGPRPKPNGPIRPPGSQEWQWGSAAAPGAPSRNGEIGRPMDGEG